MFWHIAVILVFFYFESCLPAFSLPGTVWFDNISSGYDGCQGVGFRCQPRIRPKFSTPSNYLWEFHPLSSRKMLRPMVRVARLLERWSHACPQAQNRKEPRTTWDLLGNYRRQTLSMCASFEWRHVWTNWLPGDTWRMSGSVCWSVVFCMRLIIDDVITAGTAIREFLGCIWSCSCRRWWLSSECVRMERVPSAAVPWLSVATARHSAWIHPFWIWEVAPMAAHYMVLAIVRSMDLLAAQSLGLQRFSNAKSLVDLGGLRATPKMKSCIFVHVWRLRFQVQCWFEEGEQDVPKRVPFTWNMVPDADGSNSGAE